MAKLSKTLILRDKLYIPIDHIDTDLVEQTYTKMFYDERACRTCDNKHEKHNYICDECPAFKGQFNTFNYRNIKGHQFVGIPIGQRREALALFDIDHTKFNVVDKRSAVPFDHPVRFKGTLRDYQEIANKQWLKTKYGLLISPPRSGKTLMILEIGIRLGYRFVLLANQYEFLKQFIEHVDKYTNLPQLERKTGKKLYGYPKTEKDFKTYQIMCCTYQQFLSEKGKQKLKWLTDNVGFAAVDEVQRGNSQEFAKVVGSLYVKHIGGFTATDKRKDGRHVIIHDLIGPIRHIVKREEMVPKLTVHLTGVKSRSAYTGQAGFVYAMRFLAQNEKRNDQIIETVIKDLKKGRSIVIPTTRKDHVFKLVERINQAWGSRIADYFVGGAGKKGKERRDKIIAEARSGKIMVVVGIRSLLQEGINVPRWSTLYYIQPMSNKPNWKQLSSRILTPDDEGIGKQAPLIRFFVDQDIGLCSGCFTNTWVHSLQFGYKPTDAARDRASTMLSKTKQRSIEIADNNTNKHNSQSYGAGIFSKLRRRY